MYLQGVSEGRVNVAHFACVDSKEIAIEYREIRAERNPHSYPSSLGEPFGKFNVSSVDGVSAHISRFNIAKAREYDYLYVMASH